MTQFEQGLSSLLDELPTLPPAMPLHAAALWSVGVLLHEALRRGWPLQDVRRLLLVMLVNASDDATEDELRNDFESALGQVQAASRPLQ